MSVKNQDTFNFIEILSNQRKLDWGWAFLINWRLCLFCYTVNFDGNKTFFLQTCPPALCGVFWDTMGFLLQRMRRRWLNLQGWRIFWQKAAFLCSLCETDANKMLTQHLLLSGEGTSRRSALWSWLPPLKGFHFIRLANSERGRLFCEHILALWVNKAHRR